MNFKTKKTMAAFAAIVVGLMMCSSCIVPVWLVRNVHVPAAQGGMLAILVLAAAFALAFFGKELVAMGYDTLRTNRL